MADTEEVEAPTSGVGKFAFVDGSRYEGEWCLSDDGAARKQRHGRGTLLDGPERYEGGWEADAMSGEGTYSFASGATYTGAMAANAFHGEGAYSFADGAVYVGGWREGRMHGQGSYTDPEGVEWAGQFFNGKYNNGRAFVCLR
jgi:hypothetical protein